MKKTLFLLFFLSLISCGADVPYKTFDAQERKAGHLNVIICNSLEFEVNRIKTDEYMYENYNSPEYFNEKYEEITGEAIGFWNQLSKTMWNTETRRHETAPISDKEKYLNATVNDTPAIESLTCQNYVKEWHDAVKELLHNGPYQKSFFDKTVTYIESTTKLIGNWFGWAIAIFLICGATVLSYRGFKQFVVTKVFADFFWALIFSGGGGLIAIFIDKEFFDSSVSSFTIWWASSLIYSIACIFIAILHNKKNKI